MANLEHLLILKRGVKVWNEWREAVYSTDLVPDLSEADLTEANLQGIDFRFTNVTKALLIAANLEGGDFRGADFTGANLHRAFLAGTNLYMANFSGVNLSGANLRGAKLGINLTKANLTAANLSHASLNGATLVQADLTNANLQGASLSSADLSGASLRRSNLQGAKLTSTLLWAADLSGARLAGSQLREARFTKPSLEKSSGGLLGAINFGSSEAYGKPSPVETAKEEQEVHAAKPLQFTVYFPPELAPQQWQLLLAYAHAPDAIDEVKLDSKKRLGLSSKDYQRSAKIGSTNVEKGAEIVVVPELSGCRFNPARASFLWLEDSHCVEFKVQAGRELPGFEPGIASNGTLSFYVGPVLIGEVKFWAHFSEDNELLGDTTQTEVTNDAYQAIFVSYSHQDTHIVKQLERAYRALGMQYLRDVATLRSGEQWNPALLRKIDAADIFQLCWSSAAKGSIHVEQEWRHALDLERSHFIRPVYWEQPLPEPPQELGSFHFAFMELADK